MNTLFLLDWALIAASFFNTIALLWLGSTILLNAERRSWGTWLAGGGLVLGGLFYAGHTTVVGRTISEFSQREMEFWWRVSWIPVVSAPYLWYLVMAWFTGVLKTRYHRAWLLLISVVGLVALGLLRRSNLLPTPQEVVLRAPVEIFFIAGVPVVALVYPVYSILCIVLSLSALRRPLASERFMGDQARGRARPWLIATSLVLLAISLAFGAAIVWFLSRIHLRMPPLYFINQLGVLMIFDLLVSGLGAVAIVLAGRAIVAYELFTGKALPRGGLYLHWRRSLLLALGYSLLLGATLSLPPLPSFDSIYRVLLATLLMTLFFALLSWRTYVGHERSIDQLRPFIASQRIYERMVWPAAPPHIDATEPFQALCGDVLGASVAHLVALGPLAPLVQPPLSYPPDSAAPEIADLASQLHAAKLCLALDPQRYGGAVWAIPLWSDRGLIGAMLLGQKHDGGLYTQEEIEIARAAGERLVDTQASAEMARRLMELQRQRLAESQLLDRRTRRVLHDDVLPQIHTAMLMLSGVPRQPEAEARGSDNRQDQASAEHNPAPEVVRLLAGIHHQIADLLHAMPTTAAKEVSRLGLMGALKQAVDGELRQAFDAICWQVDVQAEAIARTLPPLTGEVLFYAAREAIRNAARYGRDTDMGRPLQLTIALEEYSGLRLTIEDDGVGMAANAKTPAGSGRGLELHSTMLAVVGGLMLVESTPGSHTRIALELPRNAWSADGAK